MLHLLYVDVMEPEPFHIEELPIATEGIVPGGGAAWRASHAAVALECSALVHGENQDDRGGSSERIVELLLVFALSRPYIVLHRFHNIVAIIAGDDEEASLRIL